MLQPALILALVPRREARPQYARSDTVARHTLGSALELATASVFNLTRNVNPPGLPWYTLAHKCLSEYPRHEHQV